MRPVLCLLLAAAAMLAAGCRNCPCDHDHASHCHAAPAPLNPLAGEPLAKILPLQVDVFYVFHGGPLDGQVLGEAALVPGIHGPNDLPVRNQVYGYTRSTRPERTAGTSWRVHVLWLAPPQPAPGSPGPGAQPPIGQPPPQSKSKSPG